MTHDTALKMTVITLMQLVVRQLTADIPAQSNKHCLCSWLMGKFAQCFQMAP